MKREIDRKAYLDYARCFTPTEKELSSELAEWLPQSIIDCHAHCNLPEHVLSVDDRTYGHMLSTFPSFSLEESKEWHARLYPGKAIRSLRFPKTFRGINHRAANLYLLERSDGRDRVALYGLPDDVDYTIGMLGQPRVSALKMYYSYLEPPATEIYQYFPKKVLLAAQRLNIPIILHPPQRITSCLSQILRLCADFPRLRICLAHLSLTKQVVPGLERAFAAIADHPLVSFDTSLVPSKEVVAMALRIVGPDRIMYGSDEPLNLIRALPYANPQLGTRLIAEYPYHWLDETEYMEYKHLAAGVTHSHWQSLSAIKMAVSCFPEPEQEGIKRKIFYDNARAFYDF